MPSPLWIFSSSQNIFCTPESLAFCGDVHKLYCALRISTLSAKCFEIPNQMEIHTLILLSPVSRGAANSWKMPAAPNKDGKPLEVEIRLKAAGQYFFFPDSHSNWDIKTNVMSCHLWTALAQLWHELALLHHTNLLKLQGNKHFSPSPSTLSS